jgi:hypothetical protein
MQAPAPYASPPQPYGFGQFAAPARVPSRNVALIVCGSIVLFVGLLTLAVFAYNAWQYATVEDRFSDIEGAGWVVELVKEADYKRMLVFGPLSGVFLIGGVVMTVLGLRKR